ncbi:DNA repair exonuclease [Leuconostocaceae bacterium ESL0958]|nr:DNA repair exonuclease [Leuconostocaceae bacterium ESL0958]
MLKFIHAGDVHLGTPFAGLLTKLRPDFQTAVQRATNEALQTLVARAIAEEVDCVLFPGDLYNSGENSALIQAELQVAFSKLAAAGIVVAVSFGNHDFQAGQRAHLDWPEQVLVFDQAVEQKAFQTRRGQRVVLTGFSYGSQAEKSSPLANFPVRDTTADYQIGLYHGALGQPGDRYAPFTVADLLSKNYDYWALGHIHQRTVLHQQPPILYSGNLQGLNRTETGPKGFYLVSDEGQQGLLPTFVPASPVRFEQLILQQPTSMAAIQQQVAAEHYGQKTLLSLTLMGPLGPAVQAAVDGDYLLAALQDGTPADSAYWPIQVTVKEQGSTRASTLPNLEQVGDLTAAIQSATNYDVLAGYLGDQVPAFLRSYLQSPAGQTALQKKILAMITKGEQQNEDKSH